MVSDVDKDKINDALIKNIEDLDGHYNTGIIGFRFLFDVLFNSKRADIALGVLSQTDYPSIGYYFANPDEPAIESLWEIADANKEGPSMNSRNHHMWSSYSSYLVRKVAGIDISQSRAIVEENVRETDRFPFDRLEFSPSFGSQSKVGRTESRVSDLSSANLTLHLNQGDAKWSWKYNGGTQCDRAPLGYQVHLDCGENGGVIEKVLFASFGYPKGVNCDSLVIDNLVHSPESMNVVNKNCLGKQGCDIMANEDIFPLKADSDNYVDSTGKVKQLAVKVICSKRSQLALNATLPLGTKGRIKLPNTEDIKSIVTLKPETKEWTALDQDDAIELQNDSIELKRTGQYRFKINY